MTDNQLLNPPQIPNMLPADIVDHLDRYIIGQDEAKKAIAVALRNRYRRSKLPKDYQLEIVPSNLIMIGPTGVGKTEIVRRVCQILGTPYVKVEATKFTEVGYVGRDVESMIRDLIDASIRMVYAHQAEQVKDEAEKLANERLVDLLVPKRFHKRKSNTASLQNPMELIFGGIKQEEDPPESPDEIKARQDQRQIFTEKLKRFELEDQIIEIEVEEKTASNDLLSSMGMDQVMDNMNDMMKNIMPIKKKKRRVPISEARRILTEEETEKLIDADQVNEQAIYLAENHGIVFIDEIDKIAASGHKGGPDVSREGVQRDILPIVEGTVVKTKYGNIKTDHMLFIAAGAFHVSKPEDLIPELQGRFPVKVRLQSLSQEDFRRILVEPDYAITEQYKHLLQADGCQLSFSTEALDEIAYIAYNLNDSEENLGARRLTSILEKLLGDLLFHAGEKEESIEISLDDVKDTFKDVTIQNSVGKFLL